MDIFDSDELTALENLQGTPPPPEPPEPASHKSAGLAFLLSLVVPGAGQLYCGKTRRGVLTLLFFAASAVLTIVMFPSEGKQAENLMGIGLRTGLFLYLFAFLDAYFTAREINSGADVHLEKNPRVAAILNLVTRGLGYYYIGERGKGVVLFFLIGIVNRVVLRIENDDLQTWMMLFLEVALAILAVDAYRLAAKISREKLEGVSFAPRSPVTEEFGPAAPLALGGLLVASYAGLVGLAMFGLPDYAVVDQSAAFLTEGEETKNYSNPTYGVELQVPASWEFDQSDSEMIIEGELLGGVCNFGLMPDTVLFFVPLDWTAQRLQDTILEQNDNFSLLERRSSTLGGTTAIELRFQADVDGDKVFQSYYLTKRGSTLYAYIETFPEGFEKLCQSDMGAIRESVVLPN